MMLRIGGNKTEAPFRGGAPPPPGRVPRIIRALGNKNRNDEKLEEGVVKENDGEVDCREHD